jgi:ribonuclease P protein component
MIKKTNRLKKSRQIKTVFERGRGFAGEFFRAKYFQKWGNQANSESCLAVIIPKKIAKKAVSRNLIRRRIQSAAYHKVIALHGYDIVILPNGRALKTDFDSLKKEVEKCLDLLAKRQ